MIERRISHLFSTSEIFESHKEIYENALNASGYKAKMKHVEHNTNATKKRKRSRDITWFNPPYCHTVKTDVGYKFKQLVKKHFTKKPPIYTIKL